MLSISDNVLNPTKALTNAHIAIDIQINLIIFVMVFNISEV